MHFLRKIRASEFSIYQWQGETSLSFFSEIYELTKNMFSDFVPLGYYQNKIHMSGQLTVISKDEIVWGIFKFLTTTLMPLLFRQITFLFCRTGPTFQ